jgi:NADH-quinone oxidoreductase subunit N
MPVSADWSYIVQTFSPELVLIGLGILVLLVDLVLPAENCRKGVTLVAVLGCLVAAGFAATHWAAADGAAPAFASQEVLQTASRQGYAIMAPLGAMPDSYARQTLLALRPSPTTAPGIAVTSWRPGLAAWWHFAHDRFADAMKLIFCLAAALVLLLQTRFPVVRYRGEFVVLLIFSTVGLMVMTTALDLVIIFLGLELASLCLYALAAWHKGDPRSAEAGTKYLLLGSLASAFFIFGASLLFVRFGSTHLPTLAAGGMLHPEPFVLVGLLLLLVGFAFKVAAAPFHLWAPDVYQGAPTAAVAFLSTASKAAGFAVLVRVLLLGFPVLIPQWVTLVGALSALSMVVGNLVAVHQNDVKRLLAYSGIAQAGYLLIGVMAIGLARLDGHADPALGVTALVLYLFLYTVGNIGAFAIVGIVAQETGSTEMAAFAGLRDRAPVLAFSMLLLLLSLGGIPLLSGFVGKWFLFMAGVEHGQYWLVLLGAVMSTVSIYYYLLIAKQMYIYAAPAQAGPIRIGRTAGLGLCVILALTVWIGVYPAPFLELARATALTLAQ